jgi:ATP-dependent exoDNAse (exonuclease V) beta subunit
VTPAREPDRSLFIEASAGTGKTTRLIGEIVQCVSRDVPLREIVAVTFTHAAAGDMKLRLREELGKAGLPAADLELAFIGTIHSFCARLLRERPVEAGIDPRFSELDEQGAAAVFGRVFRRWAEERLSKPNPVLRRVLTRLTWRDDEEGRDPLGSLRDAAWSLVQWRDHPKAWAQAEGFDRRSSIDSIIEAAGRIADMLPNKPKDTIVRGLMPVAEFAARARRALEAGVRDDDLLEADAIGILRSTQFYKKGTGYLTKEVSRDALHDQWGQLGFNIKKFKLAAEAELVSLLRDELWELVGLYQNAKAKAGQVDFNDLLFGAQKLLQNDVARGYFQARFSRLFVDEFQDTDPVQAEILLLLAANDPAVRNWREAVPADGKLLVVGDPKQSIYRFRRADVERYKVVKATLTGAGVKEDRLQICRRTVRPVIDFVNAAFAPLMGEDYLALDGGRDAIGQQPSVIALPVPYPYGSRNFSNTAIRKSVPSAVGAFIAWLVTKSRDLGWRVIDPETNEPVPIEPQHICILFRYFTLMRKDATRAYVRELEARSIPHVLVGSKSFHGREEVVVLRTALRAIEWPDDSLSVYATLRGPLFSIADEMLLLFREATGFLPHPLRKLSEDIETRFPSISEALDCLAGLHRERNSQPITVTLTRLLERVRAYPGFALRKGGERVLANVYRIVDLARRFEQNGATSFRAFVEFLEEESESGEAAETPLVERSTKGVTLMTAHKSKGLEFPIVILADMDRNMLRFDGGDRFVDEDGLAAQRLLEWAPQELLDNVAVEAERDRQEGYRLAYVAATRARDMLVIAATGDQVQKESWLAPLYPALYPAKGTWQKPASAPGCPFTGKATVLQRPQDAEPPEYLRPGLHRPENGRHEVVWFDPAILELKVEESDEGLEDGLLRPTTSEPARGLEDYSKWRDKRRAKLELGSRPTLRVQRITESDALFIDEQTRPDVIGFDTEQGPAVRVRTGRKFGDLVHALLAHAPYPGDRAALEKLAAIHEIGSKMNEADRNIAIEVALRGFAHPLVKKAFASNTVHREYPVTYEIDGDLYEGVIDLTWFDGESWTVLDYKTGPGDEPRYHRQISVYGAAMRRAKGMPVKLVVLELA